MGDRYGQIYAYILYSGILGFGFGVLYDFFRIIRMAVSIPDVLFSREKGRENKSRVAVNIIIFICDILFFVIAGCITAVFIFHVNNGNIRGIAVFGSLIGFIIYYNTVGRLVTLISGAIMRGCCYFSAFVAKRVILPLVILFFWGVRKSFRFISLVSDRIYTYRVMRRIDSAAKKGFRQIK